MDWERTTGEYTSGANLPAHHDARPGIPGHVLWVGGCTHALRCKIYFAGEFPSILSLLSSSDWNTWKSHCCLWCCSTCRKLPTATWLMGIPPSWWTSSKRWQVSCFFDLLDAQMLNWQLLMKLSFLLLLFFPKDIFQKLSAVVAQQQWLVATAAHKALVLLLSANDVVVLHCTLHALISLAHRYVHTLTLLNILVQQEPQLTWKWVWTLQASPLPLLAQSPGDW